MKLLPMVLIIPMYLNKNLSEFKMSELNYIYVSKFLKFSFDPKEVDLMANTVLIKSLTSTLLNTDKSLRPVPNIVNNWSNSIDFKEWDFYIKPSLYCEDGSEINNKHFVKTFNWLLKIYSKNSKNLPVFSKLVGWENFLINENSKIEGIKLLSNNGVRFSFSSPMDSGILNFLSIPQFAFYCESNFDLNGNWIKNKKFISSGEYKIKEVSKNLDKVVLIKRNKESNNQFEMINLYQVENVKYFELKEKNFIVIENSGNKNEIPNDLYIMEGAKNQLVALILSPVKNNIFYSMSLRQSFKKKFQNWINTNEFKKSQYIKTSTFYPENTLNFKPIESTLNLNTFKESSSINVVASTGIPVDLVEYLLKGLKSILPSNFNVNFEFVNKNNSEALKNYYSNSFYDIRISNWVIESMTNWIIEMMFCSKIGINLPDPNQSISKLVKIQYEKPMEMSKYGEKFEQIISKEAVVIPLFHKGSIWVFSNNIDSSDVSPIFPVPYIENLKIK